MTVSTETKMIAQDLVKECIDNEKQIELLHEEDRSFIKAKVEEIQRIKYVMYQPKINVLKNERDQKVEDLQKEQDAKHEEIDGKVEELSVTIQKVQRILDFLKLTEKDLTIKDEDVSGYGDKHFAPLGYIFNDDFLKVKLFIIENDKPKNKYSLVAIGKCLFRKALLELPYSYGLPCHVKTWCALQLVIKDLPTIEQLKEYWVKRKSTILAPLTKNYLIVKKDYLEVRETYKINEFQEMIKYRCECGFFYTKREIRQMSRTKECTCPKCGEKMKENR